MEVELSRVVLKNDKIENWIYHEEVSFFKMGRPLRDIQMKLGKETTN